MAIRIREDGRMFCAALNEEQDGDIYIPDGLHYQLSVEHKLIVTTPNDVHMKTGGEWWWKNQVPKGVEIENWRYD